MELNVYQVVFAGGLLFDVVASSDDHARRLLLSRLTNLADYGANIDPTECALKRVDSYVSD